MKKYKIGVIGVGILGGSISHYYESRGFRVYLFDKFKRIGTIDYVNQADIIFVCVPTPRGTNNACDISIVDETISYINDDKIVVIKSTVIPGTTDALQLKYPQHRILFCPEFLTEKRAYEDFKNPKINVVGCSATGNKPVAEKLLKLLPPAKFSRIMPAKEAELFKYFRNSYLAMKNSFANQVFQLCQATGIDYEHIKACAEADP